MPTSDSAIVVIFGITGDLSRRKLLPALAEIASSEGDKKVHRIIGITRKSDVAIDSLLEHVTDQSIIRDQIELFSLSEEDVEGYKKLNERLATIEKESGKIYQKLFYLSVPPKTISSIIHMIGVSGLSKTPHSKLLIEKPFGFDTESAKALIEDIGNSFTAEQTYRIDHYLAKALVRKFCSDRMHSIIPQDSWNAASIEKIEIVATESLDIQHRATFYDETGAMRDLVQSHLLQIAALTLMHTGSGTISSARATALALLQPVPESSIRGQYDGYRDEAENPESMTETFASLVVTSDDPEWKNVPITLITGKALAEKHTYIRVTFKEFPPRILTIPLSPEDGPEIPDAYYTVFLDALNGDRDMFVSNAEVLECWRIVDAVREYWKEHSSPIITYEKGSTMSELLRDTV
jgi:glucose-6-phosphate 1-dehydrogenase